MSMQSLDFDESTIHEVSVGGGNARSKRQQEKRNKRISSPYGESINTRQAWLNSMQQGGGFGNISSSYAMRPDNTSPHKVTRGSKPTVNRASHRDKEDMYDEIQRLKENAAAFTKEKSLLLMRLTKLEKELSKKDKLLEDSLSQTQSVYGAPSERSFGSKSMETNSMITGLRQKCHKLECLLREKDNELKAAKSDLRSTRLQELEIMCETYYQEISRMGRVVEQKGAGLTPRASTPQYSEKEKILEAKIAELEVDNATLKQQIMKTSNVKSSGATAGLISEYASLNRGELEEQHQRISKELFDLKLTNDELKTRAAVADDAVTQLVSKQNKQAEKTEKLSEDRLKFEKKLSTVQGENEAQKLVIRRLNKTVRQMEGEVERLKNQLDKEQVSFSDRIEQKSKIISQLEVEIEELSSRPPSRVEEPDLLVEKKEVQTRSKAAPLKSKKEDLTEAKPSKVKNDTMKQKEEKSVSPVPNQKDEKSRKTFFRTVDSESEDETETDSETETETDQPSERELSFAEGAKLQKKPVKELSFAEKAALREPKEEKTQSDGLTFAERAAKRRNVKDSEIKKDTKKSVLNEEDAARKIQRNYRNYSMVKSACLLQRVLRGHAARSRAAQAEHDKSAEIIQTVLKSYSAKTHHITSLNKENERPVEKTIIPDKASAEKDKLKATARPKSSRPKSSTRHRQNVPDKKDGAEERRLETTKKDGAEERKPLEKKDLLSFKREEEPKTAPDSTDEDDLVMM